MRRGGLIWPATPSDEIEVQRLPANRVITGNFDPIAPPILGRWYRAGVQLLVEATGRWPNREVAHREFMIKAGMFESMVLNDAGDYRITPASTRGWNAIEWRDFLTAVLPHMLEVAGETQAQFRDRVDRFFGIKFKEAWES